MNACVKGLNVVTKNRDKSCKIVYLGSHFSDTYVFGYRGFNADVENTVPLAERTVGAIFENF